MSQRLLLPTSLLCALALLATALVCGRVSAAEKGAKHIEIMLVWGTNDAKSPNEKLKPLDPELARKLRMFKWANYFLVTKVVVNTEPKVPVKKRLSDECEIQLKDIGESRFEVDLWGKGKHVRTIKEKVTKEELLTIAGDAKNDSAWFILVREVQ